MISNTLRLWLGVVGLLLVSSARAACPGCCSSHGGITNMCAADGRVYCVDGTVSPTCLCSTCGVTGLTPPSCTLSASPATIIMGGSSILAAACNPPATAYTWKNVPFGSTQSSGAVAPVTTTTYGVQGTNAAGTGNIATATVSVTGCPAGQYFVEGSCYTPLSASACGIERWSVKTGTDSDAARVNATAAVPSSVAQLGALQLPQSLPASTRIRPVELTVYAVDATLTLYRFTEDSDYHVVLSDAQGKTMIVELPHPDCVGQTSPFRSAIAASRAAFDSHLRATTSYKAASVPVRVFGVGFFDRLHGQTGVAPNGIELHPVLKIEFNPLAPITTDPDFPLLSDVERVFNWAEAILPQWFPTPSVSGFFDPFTYRYYATAGNFLGAANGRVYVLNVSNWNLIDVGAVGDYLPPAKAAGF